MKIAKMMVLGALAMTMLTSCEEKKQSATDSETAALILEGEDKALTPYIGSWNMNVVGVPTMGDLSMTLVFQVEEKQVTGKIKAMGMNISLNNIRLEDETLKFSLNFQNMDIPFELQHEGETSLKGKMMGEFNVTAELAE